MILKFEACAAFVFGGIALVMAIVLLYIKKNTDGEKMNRLWAAVLRIFPQKVKRQLSEKLRGIYPAEREEVLLQKFFSRLFLKIYVALMLLSFILSVYLLQSNGRQILSGGNVIERNGYGEGDRDIKIKAAIGNDEKEMDISVSELAYTKEELAEKQKQAQSYIEDVYLGKNSSADNVDKPLKLVRDIPESLISVEWSTDGADVVGEHGEILNEGLDEPVNVELVAVLKYENIKKEISFEVTVMPPDRSEMEILWREWQEKFDELNKLTRQERYLPLPKEVGGHAVKYGEAETGQAYIVPCLMVFAIILISVLAKENLDRQVSEREKEIARDYPDLIDRFVLLIGAGLTVKGTWCLISDEYIKKKNVTGRKRYLYEEMIVTMREIDNGVGEIKAYEMFGRRMGLLVYMKFSNMLVQNLRKGTADLLEILNYESINAMNERKEQAKASGEEAGTKFLLPMVLNLAVVFGMIIYAAFQSM